jgi:nitroimidazol reductase NimA-like FMN-containing flavoprotein (pyridoxamine 5'-phosphate oxidase superfamily)
MDVGKAIREYLPNIVHMSLGTCVDNQPWVCEVHFVYDDDLNLYWRSQPSRRPRYCKKSASCRKHRCTACFGREASRRVF